MFLHSSDRKIIYRDLKPSNIMLTKDKDIKLIDFGISNRFGGKTGLNAASREFASPEQLLGKKSDERSDIYSLGATLKFLLKDEPSSGMSVFLNNCMKNNPDERFQSAEEAKSALSEVGELNENEFYKLKRIVQKNIFFAIMLVLSLLGVFLCEKLKIKEKNSEYERLVTGFEEAVDSNSRKENLKKIIAKDPCMFWYSKYFDECRSDYVFDDEEAFSLEEMLERDRIHLSKKEYKEIARELGRMYMFYYSEDSEYERYLKASLWFEKASEDEREEDAYYRIAKFLLEINSMILEGKDSGMYSKYYSDLNELTETIPGEEELLKLKIISLFADSVLAYSADFIREGISIEDIRSRLDSLEEYLNEQDDSGREAGKLRSLIKSRIKDARGELDYIENNIERLY